MGGVLYALSGTGILSRFEAKAGKVWLTAGRNWIFCGTSTAMFRFQ
jgi:hypothetical protein